MGLKQNDSPSQDLGKPKEVKKLAIERESSMDITKSKIHRKECGKDSVQHKRNIFIDCVCGSSDHIGRVVITRDLEQDKRKPEVWHNTDDSVYLEFNLTNALNPSSIVDENDPFFRKLTGIDYLLMPFKRWWKRIHAAWHLIRGKEVYFSSDILMNHNSARSLATAIIETIDEMENLT